VRACRKCFEVYRDSALDRKLWEAGEGRFEHDERLIAAGRVLATQGRAPLGDRRLLHSAGRGWFFGRPLRAVAAVAGVAVVVAASAWLLHTSRAPGVSPDAAALAQVRRAVEHATLQGPFIYPGTENMKVTEAPVYRSGDVPMTDSLRAALSYLYDKYERGDATADEAYWLAAGNVATGDLDMAKDLIKGMRQRFPAEHRLLIVSAIVAAERDDVPQAIELLNEALHANPDDEAVRKNLERVYRR
jgi:hypothetical protein